MSVIMGLDVFQLDIADAFTSFYFCIFTELVFDICVLLLKVNSCTSGLTHLLVH